MTITLRTGTVAFLALGLAACDPSTPPGLSSTEALRFAEETVYFGPAEGDGVAEFRGGPPDDPERAAVMRASAGLHFEASRILESAAPLEEKDAALRELLEREGVHPFSRWTLRQGASVEMLDLIRKEGEARHRAAIPYYVENLLATRNPHADRVLWALRELEAEWPEAEVRAAAERASENALLWLTERCGPCAENPDALRREDPRRAVQAAAAELSALAGAAS